MVYGKSGFLHDRDLREQMLYIYYLHYIVVSEGLTLKLPSLAFFGSSPLNLSLDLVIILYVIFPPFFPFGRSPCGPLDKPYSTHILML